MAAMELALERACGRWPYGGKYNVRKRVAQSIIRYAKTGKTSLDALTAAGECAVAQLSQSTRRSVKLKGADIRPNCQSAAWFNTRGRAQLPAAPSGSEVRPAACSALLARFRKNFFPLAMRVRHRCLPTFTARYGNANGSQHART
jgi:hypothetical protein